MRRRFLLCTTAIVLALACGEGDRGNDHEAGSHGGPGRYQSAGIVIDVDAERGQVVIDHEDVPGLMPAMTMNYDVPDPGLLGRLAPGQEISFEIHFTGSAYRVTAVEVLAEGKGESRGVRLGISGAVPVDEPAPDFELVDQAGQPLALIDLRGKTLLLDFVYTHCPGPCPIQTALHVEVLAAVPEELRGRLHFVSISLDPERDDPEAMRAYAQSRGVDFEHWSFLTGQKETIAEVLGGYGVGRVPGADGEIEHMVITYLIDGEGMVIKRYLGLDHAAALLAEDLVRVSTAPPADG